MTPKLFMAALLGGTLALTSNLSGLAQAPAAPTAPATNVAMAPIAGAQQYVFLSKGYWWKYKGKMTTHIKKVTKEYPSIMTFRINDDMRQPDGSVWHDMQGVVEPASDALIFPKFNTRTRYIEIGQWVLKSDGIPQGATYQFQPAEQYLKLPLTAGATWLRMPVTPRQTLVDNEPITVSGPEDITVPAGKFRALKLTRGRSNGAMVVKSYDWLAPGVGLVRSTFSFMGTDFEMDLIGYTIGNRTVNVAAPPSPPPTAAPATPGARPTGAAAARPGVPVHRPAATGARPGAAVHKPAAH